VSDAIITVDLHHIEDDKTMYHASFLAPDGVFAWRNQFFDGAEHRVRVTAAPKDGTSWKPVMSDQVIDVEAIDPPGPVVAKSLAFLVGMTAFGMALGAGATRIGSARTEGVRP
jgi:hypothetical protein